MLTFRFGTYTLTALLTGVLAISQAQAQSPSLTCAKALFGDKLQEVAGGSYVAFGGYPSWYTADYAFAYGQVYFQPMVVFASPSGLAMDSDYSIGRTKRTYKSSILTSVHEISTHFINPNDFVGSAKPVSNGWFPLARPLLTYLDPSAATSKEQIEFGKYHRERFLKEFQPVLAYRLYEISKTPSDYQNRKINGQVEYELYWSRLAKYPVWLQEEEMAKGQVWQDLEALRARGHFSEAEYQKQVTPVVDQSTAIQKAREILKEKGIWHLHAPRLTKEQVKQGEELIAACSTFLSPDNEGIKEFRAKAYGMMNDTYFTQPGQFAEVLKSLGGAEAIRLRLPQIPSM
jgi:hypothetical protein